MLASRAGFRAFTVIPDGFRCLAVNNVCAFSSATIRHVPASFRSPFSSVSRFLSGSSSMSAPAVPSPSDAASIYSGIRVEEFGDPSVLKVQTGLTLRAAGPGEVKIAIKSIGVNPVDTYIRSGLHASRPPLPYTPGLDCAGVVIAVGPGVSSVKAGDRVYTYRSITGAYATEGIFPAAAVLPLPDSFSFQEGAAIGTGYSTAYRALVQKAKAVAGETVLVFGATGGVGLPTVEFATSLGLTIIGTAGSDAGIELLKSRGVAEVINHSTQDVVAKALDFTGGKGVDIVIDMAAHTNLGLDLRALKGTGGRVVIVGSRGEVTFPPREIMAREAIVTGVMLFKATPEELAEGDAATKALFESGKGRPVVGRIFSGLSEAPAAHIETISRTSGAPGRVVIDVSA